MTDLVFTLVVLAFASAMALKGAADRWRRWKAGEIGPARPAVEFVAVAAATALAYWSLGIIGRRNPLVGGALWLCSWWVLGLAWAELDERLEAWERN